MSPRWALASYSCIFGKFNLDGEIVNSSSWRLRTNADGESYESHSSIKRIFKYPQTKFKQFLYSGNVVLLELSTSIDFNENVTAACITNEPIDSDREICITVEWPANKGKFHIQIIPFSQIHGSFLVFTQNQIQKII